MRDQSISIQQMQEIAKDLKIKEFEFSYVPDIDQLIITIRETDEKVNRLKENTQVMIGMDYLEELDSIMISLRLQANDDDESTFVAVSTPHEELISYLEKVSEGKNSIQINVVGANLNNISCRHYFNSELAPIIVSRELKKIKEAKSRN